MHAITVRAYAAASNSDAKLKASALLGNATIAIDHKVTMEENFVNAARVLAIKLGWDGDFVGGSLPNGDRVFVRMDQYGTRAHERFSVQSEDLRVGKPVKINSK